MGWGYALSTLLQVIIQKVYSGKSSYYRHNLYWCQDEYPETQGYWRQQGGVC